LDKGTLRLGDNTVVNFEKTLIFLTSNLGTAEMSDELHPHFGLGSCIPHPETDHAPKLQNIAELAVRKAFSPEFVNRLDGIVTYRPLDSDAMSAILDMQLHELQKHVDKRLGNRTFHLDVPQRTRKFLLEKGTSIQYGARQLKRTLQRQLTQPLSSLIAAGEVEPGATIRVELNARKDKLVLRNVGSDLLAPAC